MWTFFQKKSNLVTIYLLCQNFKPNVLVPLPSIDTIVDITIGHAMLSLMDGFSSYNQIKIAPKDQDKTAFTFPRGTYYWNVMPFGLKNAGATY